jgi:iron complex outermembrane receptor protein
METQTKFALTPIAGAITAALYPSLQAVAQDDTRADGALEEIIVTATKREMSVQDIPATIQAITSEALESMGAKSMEDYSRFIPSMNVVSLGAGTSTVIFRGAITSSGYIAQSTSSVYLDEISISNQGAQPIIRSVDLARVEALSGPQGTLYGSDAQAGTLRIVTNKPVMNEFEAIFDGELRSGSESDESYRGSLTLNIPLVDDKLALRLVGFNDKDGGYIDNVFGHTPDSFALPQRNFDDRDPITGEQLNPDFIPFPTDPTLPWGSLDNADEVEEDWNDSKVYGARAILRWEINDRFAASVTAMNQTMDAGAYNDYDPFVGDLKTIKFHDDRQEDEFNMYSIVLEADLGFAQLVSATSYYERNLDELTDITSYAHYWAAQYCHDSYYTTIYDPRGPGYNVYYLSPADYFANPDTGNVVFFAAYCMGERVGSDFFQKSYLTSQQRKITQEIRLSSQGERFDWIVGAYFEDSADAWISDFGAPTTGGDGSNLTYEGSISNQFYEFYWSNYYTNLLGTPTSVTFPGSTSNWHSESHTDWEQKAIFGELTWNISEQLDLTLGGRYFERENTQYYQVNHPGGRSPVPGQPMLGEPDGTAERDRQEILANGGFPVGRSATETEFVPKIALSYSFGDDKMVYGLYTQGKRPGGINRSRGDPFFPRAYEADSMDNYEIGFRSSFAGGQGRFNATAYHMKWSDYQLEIVDPTDPPCTDANGDPLLPERDFAQPGVCGQPWQQIVANLGEAHIDGLNIEIDYAPSDRMTLGMNIEFMEAQTDTSHDLDGLEGEVDPVTGAFDLEIIGGLRLPTVPEVKWSAWGEYHWPTNLFGSGNEAYIRTQWSYTGDSFSTLEPRPTTDQNPQFLNEAYTIGDLRVGMQGDDWDVSLFVNNLTDERAQYTHGDGYFDWAAANVADGRPHVGRVYTNRPREYGVRFMKRWGD